MLFVGIVAGTYTGIYFHQAIIYIQKKWTYQLKLLVRLTITVLDIYTRR